MVSQSSPHDEAPGKANTADRDGTRAPGPRLFPETADAWSRLGLYERFEQLVSLVLTLLIGLVIVVATVHLVVNVSHLLAFNLTDPVEPSAFQAIFGMILTVLIAMEFNHSIIGILRRKQSIVRLRTVILIALLAMARKFIVIDALHVEPLLVAGLAFAVLALGCVYWLVREQDRRDRADDGRNAASC